jgi:hypothetical protein
MDKLGDIENYIIFGFSYSFLPPIKMLIPKSLFSSKFLL